MKIETSTTFDPTQVIRVRLMIMSSTDQELFDRELGTRDAQLYSISGKEVVDAFNARIEQLKEHKFDICGKLYVTSLPHGHQILTTDFNNREEMVGLSHLFILASSELIR